MFRFIIPIILIGIAITTFFTFTNPLYRDVLLLREEVSAYNEALGNSKALENERDKLSQKYNAIGSENLNKLEKLLPESVDNIRLILEIEKLAAPYGMVLKDVKYDANQEEADSKSGIIQGGVVANKNKNYGVWNLGFSTEGTYNNFLNFVKDIENNLRIVDIVEVSFSSDAKNPTLASDVYKYNFSIKTYWLKD